MENTERIVILEAESADRERLRAELQAAGYDTLCFATTREALEALRHSGTDILLSDASLPGLNLLEMLSTIRGSAATASAHVILLVGAGAEERAAGINLGANDAISRPWEPSEMVSRVRAQFRTRAAEQQLRDQMRLADEGRQIAYTAFDALAVTEKMTKDAFKLDRRLKVGLAAVFGVVAVMAGIYFLFARSAQRENQRANAIIARLEGGLNPGDLVAEARRLREQGGGTNSMALDKEALQKQADDLKARIARTNSEGMAALQKELQETNTRLQRVEQGGTAAQNLIPSAVQSVCLLHVSVAFRHLQSGRRLRYTGLDQQGEPLRDAQGNPIMTLDGRGPEVKFDIFGTGFVAGPDGLVVTNRHVAEPWWKNEELDALSGEGLQSEIFRIRAYFPGDPRAFPAEIKDISQTTDLATMRVDLRDLERTVLATDPTQNAASSGKAIVSIGYATGLAGILARTDDDTAENILTGSQGQVPRILDELARRGLIRPIVTQGHIGDVLPERIIFDAQTTSGGSGGPLFNEQGKVIGVTYAVLQGFGGSNFGIPIRLSQPLLGQ